MTRLKQIRQVLYYTLFLNISVALAKIIYGYTINSISMRSDGLHSFFDGTSNIIGLAGIWIASKPPDETHPYGHRKFETLSTIAIAVLIFAAGFEILRESYARLTTAEEISVPLASFIVMVITMIINFGVMTYEKRKGKELQSEILVADAMHTHADIFISLSVIVSLAAAKAGYPVVDVIAAMIIVLFIVKMGVSILRPATDVLTDAACINPDEIKELVIGIDGVLDCHEIRTRGNEDFMNIDLHLQVNPEEKTKDAHEIAHTVEETIKNNYPSAKDVVVHIEPYKHGHE